MLTKIRDCFGKTEWTYTLPPEAALVAVHEQVVRKNFSTWSYKQPKHYPIETTPIGMRLGTFVVVELLPC